MPCYDKKLEAVRPDFKSVEQPIKEVDNVLATHELLDLFEKLNTNFAEVKAHERQQQEQMEEPSVVEALIQAAANPSVFQLHSFLNRSSNGYSEYILRRLAAEIFKISIPAEEGLTYKQGKNKHYQEMSYPGVVGVKFVKAYGFQHIQNVIRKLKTSKCDYDYVELMACPSGCVNGGG